MQANEHGTSSGFFFLQLKELQRWLSTGEGKWAVALKSLIRLGCLVQRLTVYRGLQVGCPQERVNGQWLSRA